MIVYDGIINSLQSHGGISVLFEELYKRLQDKSRYYVYSDCPKLGGDTELLNPRFLERYLKFNVKLNETDIFHSTYYRLPTSKVKVITTVHDFTYEKYVGGFRSKIHSYQKYKAILNSDKIICVSENTANDLFSYCPVPESKVEVVYNGVSESYCSLGLEVLDYVVFVGSRASYKNFALVVSALSKLPEVKLLIVGGGLLTNFEINLLESNLEGRFVVKGILTNDELNLVYNQAIALVYPSEYEGFGIPVVEAQQAGCPVIALNSSSIPEVAGNAALLLDKSCENLLYEAILTLLSSDARRRFSALGLENAKRFSWEKCFNHTLNVYSK
ncbi:glycosyltransferase family 4 protein [Shewanella sp.]|uniref:glycosyltransferase family 4 protein n=1 Tax=Shewanella sp. TaxID=50422 RepID=UPI003A83EE09